MTINYNPSVTTTNLIVSLDPGNQRSYIGTGNYWNDLIGGVNPALLGTMPSYSTDGGGCFDFAANAGLNSTSAASGFYWAPQPVPNTGSFTINCWVKNVPAVVGQQLLFSNTGDANGYRYGIGVNGVYWLIGPTYTENTLGFSSFTNTQWNNVCTIFDRLGTLASGTPYMYLYLNGSFVTSAAMPASQTAWNTSGYTTTYMAKWNGQTFTSYSGKLGAFSVYSTALTAAQVLQNFNALRGRYGI